MCDNHHGITLLSIVGKILAHLILNQIFKNLMNDIYPEFHCGFCSGRGIIDMIFALCQVAKKALEKNLELDMAFVRLTKTFDMVNREAIWKVLKRLCIPVIISLHEGMKACCI